jgi:Raf kinase inhibitor-like YbhB/YbcL family protein
MTSTVFKDGESIPQKYTCDGINISPPLAWTMVPAGTKSLALICDDPDAAVNTFVHWVYYDIPAEITNLPENIPSQANPHDLGGTQGLNDYHKVGYSGPCPPRGTHRYFFKLYALDVLLNLPAGKDKQTLLQVMKGHILAEASLMGHYSR